VPAGAYSIHVDAIHPRGGSRSRRVRGAQALHHRRRSRERRQVQRRAKLQTQALTLAERALGPNDPYLGYLLSRCAELSRTTGDTAASERLFKRAIALNEAALGRENPRTAYSLLRLGALYTALDDYAKSEPLLDEALAIIERTLGNAHPRVVQALMAEVGPHYFLEDYGFVVPRFERALAIADKTLDPDDFTILAFVNNLGDVYERMEEYDKAEPRLVQVSLLDI
jgi:tetratricopeptide (TPR) repeat protein